VASVPLVFLSPVLSNTLAQSDGPNPFHKVNCTRSGFAKHWLQHRNSFRAALKVQRSCKKLCDNFLAFVLFCGYMWGEHVYALEILPYAVDASWQLFPSFYFLVCVFSGR
jgi:hypothetical protein